MTTTIPAPHFLDLEGAETVWTGPFRLVRRLVTDCQNNLGLSVVHGVAGVGKTFAVRSALADLAHLQVVSVTFPGRTTQKLIAHTLLSKLTGDPGSGSIFRLQDQLVEELSQRATLVYIDEAQRLGGHLIEFLRSVYDDENTQLALILAGGNRCWHVLSREPMLRSRVHRRVEFTEWTEAATIRNVRAFHPMYRDTDDDVILYVNRLFGHGNFRQWANFTKTAVDICRANGRDEVDIEIAKNAFCLLGGGRSTDATEADSQTVAEG